MMFYKNRIKNEVYAPPRCFILKKQPMKPTKKTIMEALNMFCFADHPKKHLQKPIKEGNFIFSSDGFSMIWCDSNIIKTDEIKTVKVPFLMSVIPDYDKHVSIEIDVNQMINFIENSAPKVDETVDFHHECPTCKGKGFIITDSFNGVCHKCDGGGDTQIRRPTGNKIPYNKTHFYDGEGIFTYWQIRRVLRLAELLKIDKISMKHGAGHDPYFYEIGAFKVIMMPIQCKELLIKNSIHFRY